MAENATKTGASYSIQCSHCQAVLKSPVPVPGGKTVKCPRCKQSFTTPEPSKTRIDAKTAVAPPAPASAALDDDAEMEAAIAKLQGDAGVGAPPPAAAPQPAAPPAPAPSAADPLDDDAEMAAAIAKLQGDGGLGAPPAPPPAAKSEPAPPIPDMEIPEIDDDLVVPDEEGPAAEDVAEDFHMEVDEDDEAAGKQKKKKRAGDDEDDEAISDKPAGKRKKGRPDDDNNDDEDEDRRAKNKKRRADEDDDDDDEPRTKKKKKKKAGSPMLLIGLIGGGLFALLLCCGLGIGGFVLFGGGLGGPDVVGRWEQNQIIKITYEFRPDGKGRMETILSYDFHYRVSGNKLTVEPIIFGMKADPITYTVRRTGDTLHLRDDAKGTELELRKIP